MDLIGKLIKKKGQQSIMAGVKAAMIVEYANQALSEFFGSDVLSSIEASHTKNQVIYFKTTNATARQEIMLNQATIIDKINQKSTYSNIEKIKFVS